MGDSFETNFGIGRRPTSPRLGEDLRLQLDPTIQAQLNALLLTGRIDQLRARAEKPDWSSVILAISPRSILFLPARPGLPGPSAPLSLLTPSKTVDPSRPVADKEPDPPREGKVKDVLGALSEVPEFQALRTRVVTELKRDLKLTYKRLSPGELTLVIVAGAVIGGGAVAGVLAKDPERATILGMLLNNDIPVPGLDGFSFRLIPYGVESKVKIDIPKVPGVSLEAQADLDKKPNQNLNLELAVTVTVDVMRILPPMLRF